MSFQGMYLYVKVGSASGFDFEDLNPDMYVWISPKLCFPLVSILHRANDYT